MESSGEFNIQTPDGSLPEVDFPNNFNAQTSGITSRACGTTNQVVEFDIDRYFDIDEYLATAYDGGLIGEGQPEMANRQFQEDWSFENGPFEQMELEQQDPVAAFNPGFMPPPATHLVPALVTSFNPAPATTPNPISGTNSANSTNISNIPPTDGSGRPHICPDPKCGARFAKRSALNTHMRSSKAHPHQNITCRCGKGFNKYALKQHLIQQVKRCKESRADFRCHCGFTAAPKAEEEILEHAYDCSRIKGKS
ncbi:hypothetical protein THAR02_05283 [Trichoderma harzianum]|uniref:C2H2-type domain-containing protein n=1 Tax=Trichoderma harzianum TaxID=5544 RepID=A0A0F9XDB7_TRIHA|nr:hypothetical protein THAR02_05283 [Trichoderma harzianum]